MDLYIHTLTGTAFELRVSPFETIMSIKAKIQRLEGIPISQQHLIWRSVELIDDFCLHDYNICDGATLQLVLAMRGGPINTRRVPMEDPSLQEMAEYMEANQDEIWDRLPKDNRQVTLLVFRDGDQLNFFRVVDRGDGTLTPLSDSLSGASMYNLYDEEEEESQKPVSQETLKENKVTMNKMKLLRHKLQSQKITKLSTQRVNILMHDNAEALPEEIFEKPTIVVFATEQPEMLPHPPPVEKPKTTAPTARRRLRLSDTSHKQPTSQKIITTKKPDKSNTKSHLPHPPPPIEANGAKRGEGGSGSGETKEKGPLPPVNTKKGKQIDVSDFLPNTKDSKPVTNLNSSLTRSAFKDGRRSISELVKDAKEIKPLGSISKPKVTSKHKTSSPQYGDSVEYHLSGSARLRRSKNNNSALRTSVSPNGDNLEYISGGSTIRRSRIPEEYLQSRYEGEVMPASAGLARLRGLENRVHTPESRQNGFRNGSSSYKHQHNHERSVAPPHHLPPVKTHPPQLVQSKKKTRCFFCGKKTGLATTFQCRCGNTFCGTHRYAEVHGCTYDYKSEGRKILEQNNPVVAAPKLPKI